MLIFMIPPPIWKKSSIQWHQTSLSFPTLPSSLLLSSSLPFSLPFSSFIWSTTSTWIHSSCSILRGYDSPSAFPWQLLGTMRKNIVYQIVQFKWYYAHKFLVLKFVKVVVRMYAVLNKDCSISPLSREPPNKIKAILSNSTLVEIYKNSVCCITNIVNNLWANQSYLKYLLFRCKNG